MSPPPFVILVIEDDPNDVLLIKRAFEKAARGIELVVVTTVDEGIEFLQRDPLIFRPPVLILQDIKLPLKSGFELLKWIKTQPRLKRVPVIMLTASNAPSDINRAYELGANSYLIKPLAAEELAEMVGALHRYWLDYNQKPAI